MLTESPHFQAHSLRTLKKLDFLFVPQDQYASFVDSSFLIVLNEPTTLYLHVHYHGSHHPFTTGLHDS